MLTPPASIRSQKPDGAAGRSCWVGHSARHSKTESHRIRTAQQLNLETCAAQQSQESSQTELRGPNDSNSPGGSEPGANERWGGCQSRPTLALAPLEQHAERGVRLLAAQHAVDGGREVHRLPRQEDGVDAWEIVEGRGRRHWKKKTSDSLALQKAVFTPLFGTHRRGMRNPSFQAPVGAMEKAKPKQCCIPQHCGRRLTAKKRTDKRRNALP